MTFRLQDFLVGDWVRNRDGEIGQVVKLGRQYLHVMAGKPSFHKFGRHEFYAGPPEYIEEITQAANGKRKIREPQ